MYKKLSVFFIIFIIFFCGISFKDVDAATKNIAVCTYTLAISDAYDENKNGSIDAEEIAEYGYTYDIRFSYDIDSTGRLVKRNAIDGFSYKSNGFPNKELQSYMNSDYSKLNGTVAPTGGCPDIYLDVTDDEEEIMGNHTNFKFSLSSGKYKFNSEYTKTVNTNENKLNELKCDIEYRTATDSRILKDAVTVSRKGDGNINVKTSIGNGIDEICSILGECSDKAWDYVTPDYDLVCPNPPKVVMYNEFTQSTDTFTSDEAENILSGDNMYTNPPGAGDLDYIDLPHIDLNKDSVQCDALKSSGLDTIIQDIYDILKVVSVALVVLLGTLDFTKAVMSQDNDLLNKAFKNFIKRVVAMLIFVFLPTFISIVLGILYDIDPNTFGVFKDPLCGIR